MKYRCAFSIIRKYGISRNDLACDAMTVGSNQFLISHVELLPQRDSKNSSPLTSAVIDTCTTSTLTPLLDHFNSSWLQLTAFLETAEKETLYAFVLSNSEYLFAYRSASDEPLLLFGLWVAQMETCVEITSHNSISQIEADLPVFNTTFKYASKSMETGRFSSCVRGLCGVSTDVSVSHVSSVERKTRY